MTRKIENSNLLILYLQINCADFVEKRRLRKVSQSGTGPNKINRL